MWGNKFQVLVISIVFLMLFSVSAQAYEPRPMREFPFGADDFIMYSKTFLPSLNITIKDLTITGVLNAQETHITNTTVTDVNVTGNMTVLDTVTAKYFNGTWNGSPTGNISDTFVPYIGAIDNLLMGTYDISADNFNGTSMNLTEGIRIRNSVTGYSDTDGLYFYLTGDNIEYRMYEDAEQRWFINNMQILTLSSVGLYSGRNITAGDTFIGSYLQSYGGVDDIVVMNSLDMNDNSIYNITDINTTSLQVEYNLTVGHTLIAENISIGDGTLFTTSDGNVGIGTVPDYTLEIKTGADDARIIHIDAETVPYTGSETNYGINIDRLIRTPPSSTGLFSIGFRNWITDEHNITGAVPIASVSNMGSWYQIRNFAEHSITPFVQFTEYNWGMRNNVIRTGTQTSTKTTIYNYGQFNEVETTIDYNKAGGTLALNEYGTYSYVGGACTETAGTLNRNSYGNYIDVDSAGGGNVNAYGLYIAGVTGNNTWGIYDASGADWYMAGNVGIRTPDPNATIHIDGDGIVTENFTAENVWLPTYCFAHTADTQNITGAGVWLNVSFDEEASFCTHMTHTHSDSTNDTFTIQDDGVYDITYHLTFSDTAPSPSGHVEMRIIRNATEIAGSALEEDSSKQYNDFTIGNGVIATLTADDRIIFQFTGDDTTIGMSVHAAYADHRDTGVIKIRRIG